MEQKVGIDRTWIMEMTKISWLIYSVRGQRVMFDSDLALLYDVKTKELNKAVSRNILRFPDDFMFKLTREEFKNLRFQIGTSSWGGARYVPRAFTEQGVAMLSSVLRSNRAAFVNIAIMRAFVGLRQLQGSHKDLAERMDKVEHKMTSHDVLIRAQAKEIRAILNAIRKMIEPMKARRKKRIGFLTDQGCES